MSNDILTDLEALRIETGLSEHRIGILVAKNGRLFDRVRMNRPMWPETRQKVLTGIEEVRAERSNPPSGDAA